MSYFLSFAVIFWIVSVLNWKNYPFFCCQTASLGSGGLIIQFIIFAYVILRKLMALRFFLVFGFNWLWWNWADNGRKVFILTSVKVLLLRCTVCSVKVVPIDSNEALVINAHWWVLTQILVRRTLSCVSITARWREVRLIRVDTPFWLTDLASLQDFNSCLA